MGLDRMNIVEVMQGTIMLTQKRLTEVRLREFPADYLIKPLDDSHLDNTLKRLTPLQHLVGDFQPQQGRD